MRPRVCLGYLHKCRGPKICLRLLVMRISSKFAILVVSLNGTGTLRRLTSAGHKLPRWGVPKPGKWSCFPQAEFPTETDLDSPACHFTLDRHGASPQIFQFAAGIPRKWEALCTAKVEFCAYPGDAAFARSRTPAVGLPLVIILAMGSCSRRDAESGSWSSDKPP